MLRAGCIIVVGILFFDPFVWAQPQSGTPPPPGGPHPVASGIGGAPGGPPPGPRSAGAPGPEVPPGSAAPGDSPPAEPNGPGAEDSPVPPPPPMVMPAGDTVTLKSGKVLKNVQVLKTTLTEVHVQTLLNSSEDLPPLIVPRKFVESIEYDDYDPKTAALAKKQSQQNPGVMSGFAVSKDMGEKLHGKLPAPRLSFEDRDVLDVLRDLSKTVGVTIDVSDGVRAIPTQDRRWTFQAADDMTLFLLLQEKLPEKFPNLAVDYQFDRILVRTKEEGAPAAKEPADAPTNATTAPAP